MGLDITAYRKLKVVENPQIDEYGELENWDTEWRPGGSMEWSEKHFPGRGEGIDPQKVYSWEEEFGFRAGSYSGYNWWRAKLEQFASGNDFDELINFADNEGVIGFIVSKKLAKDFKENEIKAKEFAETINDGDWWFSQYQRWKKAFEIASDNGAVDFH
ncbi:hypothetical protein HYI36_00780 [Bacillus sp. Gen3]|uniref:hypothetical protein n=1 Tax=Heyndrickxia oleronia TaxID=38875 RepID=UPI0015D46910|nr:hypothetical protein [Bacillus sp. Gen3]